jgi:hypothetical protein
MTAATMTLASSSSSAINQGAASPSVGDGSTPPVSGLAEGSGEVVRLGIGVGEAVELGAGVGVAVGLGVAVGEGVGSAAVTTATPLQVEPQPVAA